MKTKQPKRRRARVSPVLPARSFSASTLFHNMINGALRLSFVMNRNKELSDFVILDANAAWERFTGMRRASVAGRRISGLFPSMEPRLISITRRMIKEKKGQYFEYYSRLFDRWFQTSVFPAVPGECMMLFSDITEIKRGQKNLEESEEKFRSIIEQSGDGIVLIDETGKIIEYNATMEKICGIRRAEAVGRKMWEIQYRILTPDKRSHFNVDAYRQDFILSMKKGSSNWIDKVFEVNAVREDGAPMVLQILVSLIRVGHRKTFVSFCRDVTPLRQAEKELEQQNRLLLEKNIALREVMAQLEVEKKRMAEKVKTNVERLVLPLLERIKRKSAAGIEKQVQLLEENLRDITAGFGSVLSQGLTKLTRQEIEICDMIRQGLRCREIAEILNISVRTVETHRNHIRRKLSIGGSSNNLVTYLKNIT